jgi:hypothetical protein
MLRPAPNSQPSDDDLRAKRYSAIRVFELRQRIDQRHLRSVLLDLALDDAGGVTRFDRARHVLSAVAGKTWRERHRAALRPRAKIVPSSNGHAYLRAMHIRNAGMLLNTSTCPISTASNVILSIRDAR